MTALQQLPIENPDDSRDVSLLDLPFDIMVQILRCLNQEERINVSKTCTQLRDFSLHRCLWSSVCFDLTGLSDLENPNKITFEHEVEKEVLEACVDSVMDFKVHLNGSFTDLDMDTELFQHLDKATKSWCLKSFTFAHDFGCRDCHKETSFFCLKCQMMPSFRQIFANCLTSQNDQFESLDIFNRNCGQEDGVSVLMKVLLESPSTFTFKNIKIDWYSSRFPAIPSAHLSAVSLFLSRCPSLQELGIHSRYLTNELLQNLSKPSHVKLKNLWLGGGRFSETLTSWPTLLASSPSLEVAVVLDPKNSDIDEIRNALPEIVPVSRWCIVQKGRNAGIYEQVHKNHLQFLHEYAWTLKKIFFASMDLFHNCEDIILSLAKKCPYLFTIEFDGKISSNCILQLAKIKKWKKFLFSVRAIRFHKTLESDHMKHKENIGKVTECLGDTFRCYRTSGGNCNVAADVSHSTSNGMQLTARPTRSKIE